MAQEYVDAAIRDNKVVVFSKPTCSYCTLAKEVLSNYELKPGSIEFVDITKLKDMGSLQDYLLELTGARTVPRVFIGQECVGGGSDVAALHNSGKLKGKLEAIGALQ